MKQSPKNNQFESSSRVTDTWVGIGLLLMAAIGFTTTILSSNMAYKDGIDVHSVNTVRYSVSVFLLFLFQKIRGKQLKLPLRERIISLGLGITVFMMGIGYLGATQYIPVSLAVLIFYTSPFLVAVISRFTEKTN